MPYPQIISDIMALEEQGQDAGIPGMLIFFSGLLGGDGNKHPIFTGYTVEDTSYALCDGGTYTAPDGVAVTTPDLRDRFIIGASATRAVGTAGGSNAHDHGGATGSTVAVNQAHTLTVAQMPAHTHTLPFSYAAISAGTAEPSANAATANTTSTGSTGGGGAHTHGQDEHSHAIVATGVEEDTMPAYCALAIIMKL